MSELREKIEADSDDDDDDNGSFDKLMTTISQHYFGDKSDNRSFVVSIIENMKEEYGLFVWPCSIILAEYVWQQRFRFSGASVIELGAGTSLPGLVAAKVGSDVTLTDDSNRIEVLENMKRVCELNKLKCKVLGLTWGVWDASVFNLHPKIILGADVFYESSAFDDLFATVTYLLQNSPGSVFITSYHNRSGHHLIEFLMVKWGLKCVKLLDGFSILPPYKASGLSGNIQLAEIILGGELAEFFNWACRWKSQIPPAGTVQGYSSVQLFRHCQAIDVIPSWPLGVGFLALDDLPWECNTDRVFCSCTSRTK